MIRHSVALKRFLNCFFVVIFWLLLFLNLFNFCIGHGHVHDHDHDHDHHNSHEVPSFKYSKEANEAYSKPQKTNASWMLWAEALASTFFISAAPFLILFFVPLEKSKQKEPLLKILLSFASGGLLGDAFLHLIPHALVPHSHSDVHSGEKEHGHDMSVGLSVLLGIVTFLLVEKTVRSVKGGDGHGHSHGGNEVSLKKKNKIENEKTREAEKSEKPGGKKSKSEGIQL